MFSAIAGNKEFAKNFEFIAVSDPSKITQQQLNIQSLPALIGGFPAEDNEKTQES